MRITTRSVYEILDKMPIEDIRPVFKVLVNYSRLLGIFDTYKYIDDYVLVAIDGTEHFCSNGISCKYCLIRQSKSKVQYYHNALAAVAVSPTFSTVLPLMVEPIVKEDGETKNDCELNSAKRLLPYLSSYYPKDKLLIIGDALFANAPI